MSLNDVLDFVPVEQLDIDIDTVGFGCFGTVLLDSGVEKACTICWFWIR